MSSLLLAGSAQRRDGGDDAAARARHLFIGRAGKPHLELVRPVARMDQMGVAIDQTRRDPPAFAVDHLARLACAERQLRFRTDIGDPAVPDGKGSGFDEAQTRQARIERRQPRIAPDPVKTAAGRG